MIWRSSPRPDGAGAHCQGACLLLASQQFLRFDHPLGELGDGNPALLAFELEAPMGFRLVEIHPSHEDPLGPFDELAGLKGPGKTLVLEDELLLLLESANRDLDLGLKSL